MPAQARPPIVAVEAGADPFFDEAGKTLRELRAATGSVIAACGGIERATDVATRLDLDSSIAWKLWHVGRDVAGLPSPAHIPGKQGYERFLQAAAALGIEPAVIDRARAAFAGFQQLARHHAGDRAAADRLIGAITDEGRSRLDTSIRRDGFRANAYLLGVQADSVYQLDALKPVGAEFMPEVFRVRGHFGLQRNRANAPWVMSRTMLVYDAGRSEDLKRSPIDGRPEATNSPGSLLLAQFCSEQNIPIVRRTLADSTVEDELAAGHIGQSGALDVVLGEHFSGMPRIKQSADAMIMRVLTPAKRLVFDVLLPPGIPHRSVSYRVHSTVQSDVPYSRSDDYAQIPIAESLEVLGAASTAPEAIEVPHQGQMLRWLLARLPSAGEGYTLCRVRMKFPPVPSVVAVRYELA